MCHDAWRREVHVQSVDDTGNVTQNCEEDVDEEISVATSLEEDTDGWKENGEDDLNDVAVDRLATALV